MVSMPLSAIEDFFFLFKGYFEKTAEEEEEEEEGETKRTDKRDI